MKNFEDDLVKIIENINDEFLNSVEKDLKTINSSLNIFIFADKSRNIYESSPAHYNKILKENATKTCKHGSEEMIEETNNELKEVSSNFQLATELIS